MRTTLSRVVLTLAALPLLLLGIACNSRSGAGSSAAESRIPFHFLDVSTAMGIGPYSMAVGMGSGVAAADFDDDGDIDLFLPNGSGKPNQLYENENGKLFKDIAPDVGLAATNNDRCAIWFDYDGDHDLDLIAVNDDPNTDSSYHLYRHETDGHFTDVTREAGLFRSDTPRGHRGGVCAGDINNDGYLDFFAGVWGGTGSLFLNDTRGAFIDITDSSGVRQDQTGHWEPMMYDFNGDGWLDIYEAIDFRQNLLWINQGDETFKNVAPEVGLDNLMNDMGMSLGDFDNDGDMDIYTTNVLNSIGGHNTLFRNDSEGGTLRFTEVSQQLGVNKGGWGWGVTFMDGNNDGWLDIAATNGFNGAAYESDASRFWANTGGPDPGFKRVSRSVGFNDTYWGSCVVAFDLDRNGTLDVAQTCQGAHFRILKNAPSGKRDNYLVIQPRMDGPNHWAIGTVIHVTAGDLHMMRLITAGTSFLGEEPFEAFFGLGKAKVADDVVVEFPDGRRTELHGVQANRIIEVEPGS